MSNQDLLNQGKDFLSGVFTGQKAAVTTEVKIDEKSTMQLMIKILIAVVLTVIIIIAFSRITKK